MTKQQFLEMRLENINSYCYNNNKNSIKRYLKELLDGSGYRIVVCETGLIVKDENYVTVLNIYKTKNYWGEAVYRVWIAKDHFSKVGDSYKNNLRYDNRFYVDKVFGLIDLAINDWKLPSDIQSKRFATAKCNLQYKRHLIESYKQGIEECNAKILKLQEEIKRYQERLERMGL